MFKIIFCFLLFASYASAQNLSADEIVERLKGSAESLEDASFLLTGYLVDADGSEIPLEISVEVIPELKLARAEFVQPDALADNFTVIDDQAVYNYLYLTNQVTVLSTGDPDALGSLFPEAEAQMEEATQELDFDLEALLEGWRATVEGYGESPVGNLYRLRFTNEREGAEIGSVNAWVVDGAWYPYRLELLQADGTVLAELTLNDFERDGGLDPGALRFIPADAEVIDER